MGKNTGELQFMREEIKKLPADLSSKPAWQALGFVLVSIKGTMDEIKQDYEELINRVTTLEATVVNIKERVKVTQSDTREALNMIRKREEERHIANGKKQMSDFSKIFLGALAAGILSPIIVWLITEIFPRIFTIPRP